MSKKLQDVYKKGDKFYLRYTHPDGSATEEPYEASDIASMINKLKQAQIGGKPVMSNEEKAVASSDQKLEQTRTEIIRLIRTNRNELKSDLDYVKNQIVANTENRANLFEKLEKESQRRMAEIARLLESIFDVEKSSLASIKDRESHINDIIDDLRKKADLSWETINDSRAEVDRAREQSDAFRRSLDARFDEMQKASESSLQRLKADSQAFENEIQSSLVENINRLTELESQYTERIAKREKRMELENQDAMKRKYLKRELERKERQDEAIKEYISQRFAEIVARIESYKSEYEANFSSTHQRLLGQMDELHDLASVMPEKMDEELQKLEELEQFYVERSSMMDDNKKAFERSILIKIKNRLTKFYRLAKMRIATSKEK